MTGDLLVALRRHWWWAVAGAVAAVAGPATEPDALPYLASLLQRHCAIVVAVGPAQCAAVTADAARFPHVRFVTVGGNPAAHIARIAAGSAAHVRAEVSKAITDAVDQASVQ